ncbi:MAG: hypothetical protein HLUCCA08_01305 [Rhodobacteraceae bacterium HLUCCA08]|nr:MAG: hypothetical protein HLUCCA08_01305 [Rhodobacteraceae bacterium HLUCCA08]
MTGASPCPGPIVDQAGASRGTGDTLSADRACRITDAFEDASILARGDTAPGERGAALLLRTGGGWRVVAVDSRAFADPVARPGVPIPK